MFFMIITQDTKPKKGHGLRKSRVIRVPVLISVFSKYGYQKASTLPINKMTSVPPSVIMNKNGRSASNVAFSNTGGAAISINAIVTTAPSLPSSSTFRQADCFTIEMKCRSIKTSQRQYVKILGKVSKDTLPCMSTYLAIYVNIL